jgi:lipopolysaccharide transport system ATP-binding protein
MSNDNNIAIKVEGLYKQYRLGMIGADSLKDDIKILLGRLRGKTVEQLYKVDANDRMTGKSDYVWALHDLNFEIKKGEIMGIIGRNGAGKSTLLKVLSKVTGPTKGKIHVNGRIASLLEVGTGFHPELSGRENIFLNGAILGMSKKEIKSKLDEIIDFSGIGKYLDTPVKRYSSGMKVRLGFAVAAHLDPEILIVDEVLAVGDAEFQKKCIGKMNDVSKNQGRTVLFVSHNMGSVMELCDRGILMQNGTVKNVGTIEEIVPEYLNAFKSEKMTNDLASVEKRIGNGDIQFEKMTFLNENDEEVSFGLSGQKIKLKLDLKVNTLQYYPRLHISVKFVDKNDRPMFYVSNSVSNGTEYQLEDGVKKFSVIITVDKLPLNTGIFPFHLFCSDVRNLFDEINFANELKVEGGNFYSSAKLPPAEVSSFLVENEWDLIL